MHFSLCSRNLLLQILRQCYFFVSQRRAVSCVYSCVLGPTLARLREARFTGNISFPRCLENLWRILCSRCVFSDGSSALRVCSLTDPVLSVCVVWRILCSRCVFSDGSCSLRVCSLTDPVPSVCVLWRSLCPRCVFSHWSSALGVCSLTDPVPSACVRKTGEGSHTEFIDRVNVLSGKTGRATSSEITFTFVLSFANSNV